MNAEAVLEMEALDLEPSPELLARVVAGYFFESPARLDVRHLWTTGGVSYVRVNWWHESGGVSRITRSAFVRVESTDQGWVIRDMTVRSAA